MANYEEWLEDLTFEITKDARTRLRLNGQVWERPVCDRNIVEKMIDAARSNIIFSPGLMPAVLSQRKRQTRRTNGLDDVHALLKGASDDWEVRWEEGEVDYEALVRLTHRMTGHEEALPVRSLYREGDFLCVRENWAAWFENDDGEIRPWKDVPKEMRTEERCRHLVYQSDLNEPGALSSYYVPPIFMPYWAVRAVIYVEDVRLERLREISCRDINSEGILGDLRSEKKLIATSSIRRTRDHVCQRLRRRFRALWESLYDLPWDDTLVWVYKMLLVGRSEPNVDSSIPGILHGYRVHYV